MKNRKRWFSLYFCDSDLNIVRKQIVEFANKNNIKPGEILIIYQFEGWPKQFVGIIYYAEKELKP